MSDLIVAVGTCFLAGILTTIHPCPFTSSIASISFLASASRKRFDLVISSGLFVLGYISAYVFLSVVLVSGVITAPGLSHQLQFYFALFLGPILILVGMILVDLIRFNRFFKDRLLHWAVKKEWRGFGAFPMGLLIAFSFCPATAAIFFGMLIPLSISHEKTILFPILYALGASIPLISISVFISRGIKVSGNSFFQQKLPLIGGWVLIFAGIYISVRQIYLPYFT